MFLGEVVRLRRLDVNHADDPVLDDQRHRNFRAHVWNRRNITRVVGHIIDQDRFGALGRYPGNALANLDPHAIGNFVRVPHAEPEVEFLRFVIEQEDAKYLIINDFAHQFRDPTQSRVQVKRSVDHVRNFKQQGLDA